MPASRVSRQGTSKDKRRPPDRPSFRDAVRREFMTVEERVSAVAEFGFTQRQASFLVMAMRHGGVCLLRQYSAFAGIVHGQKTRAFFRKLVSRRYASAYECRHNRGPPLSRASLPVVR